MADPVVGFVGLGRMGGPMSGRLAAAGHTVHVFDASPEALNAAADGRHPAASAEAVGAAADIVFVSLPTPDIVHHVVVGEGGVAAGGRVRTVVDLSTTGPGMAGRVASALRERGMALIDAPVSGGVAGAKGGTLAVMVSGPKEAVALAEPLLRIFGKLFYVGEKPGLAQVAKLANNLLAASALVISCEAAAMAVKAGLDPRTLIDIVNVSSGRNSATQDKFPRAILTRTFDFGFATGLSYKDVRLCIDEAESLGVPMVAGAAVRQMLAITQARFGADSDFTSIARVVEQWAGVEIKG